jgi:hypothetical protein
MAGLKDIPLGGSIAIRVWFGLKEYYYAFEVTRNIISLSGVGSRADE